MSKSIPKQLADCRRVIAHLEQQISESQAQIAMQAAKAKEALQNFENGGNVREPLSTIISATSETVAAWRAKETEPLRREVAMLEAAMKPAYYFYMIEVERVGWFSGKKEGRLHFTHSAEDAITFFDKHSAEIILNEFFGSAVSYMHPETYGRVLVTEHMWCNRPSNTQATALAYELEVNAKAHDIAFECAARIIEGRLRDEPMDINHEIRKCAAAVRDKGWQIKFLADYAELRAANKGEPTHETLHPTRNA